MADIYSRALDCASVAEILNVPTPCVTFSHVDTERAVHFVYDAGSGSRVLDIKAMWDQIDSWVILRNGGKVGEITARDQDTIDFKS